MIRYSNWSYFSFLSLPLYFGLLRAFGLKVDDRELLEKLRNKLPFLRRRPDLRVVSYPRTDIAAD